MTWLWLLIAIAVGLIIPFQPPINAALSRAGGHFLHGTFANFIGGFVFLVVIAVILRMPMPSARELVAAPRWAWLGGLIGVSFVTASLVLSRPLGVATFLAAAIAGQMVGSLAVDHFGWVGAPRRPITIGRLAGVGLVIAGVIVIHFSTRPAPPDAASAAAPAGAGR